MAEGEHGARAVVAALLANLGIALSKFVGYLITHSASMLAEAIHSAADTGNQVLLLFGRARSHRPADEEHEFGYGRERYFWAFVVSLVLFTLGGVFALFEGVEKLRSPHELDSPAVAVTILLVAIALESWSLRTAIHESRGPKGDASWPAFIRRSRIPELPVVLLEDTGALVGLLFALVGIALAELTGDSRWDAVGSIAIGTLLVLIAGLLAVEMRSLLIGESALPEDQRAIQEAITGSPEVVRLIHLRTEHIGPDQLLVGAKLELDGALTFAEVAAAIDAVEDRVRAAVPMAHPIYLEPACFDPAQAEAGAADPPAG
jgi:cation diffusion facilitator family transporter